MRNKLVHCDSASTKTTIFQNKQVKCKKSAHDVKYICKLVSLIQKKKYIPNKIEIAVSEREREKGQLFLLSCDF